MRYWPTCYPRGRLERAAYDFYVQMPQRDTVGIAEKQIGVQFSVPGQVARTYRDDDTAGRCLSSSILYRNTCRNVGDDDGDRSGNRRSASIEHFQLG